MISLWSLNIYSSALDLAKKHMFIVLVFPNFYINILFLIQRIQNGILAMPSMLHTTLPCISKQASVGRCCCSLWTWPVEIWPMASWFVLLCAIAG